MKTPYNNLNQLSELDGSLEAFTSNFVQNMAKVYPDLDHCRSMALRAWAKCSMF